MIDPPFNMDAYAPAEMATRVETVGVAKADLDAAAGFEHSIANMYFIPIALFVDRDAHVLARVGQPVEQIAHLTWVGFFLYTLLPVTLGNMVGGVIMVAAVYWFISLRKRPGTRVVRTWRHLARFRAEVGRATHDPGEV
jgi:formate/nitrite transporter FocA (FNT family)